MEEFLLLRVSDVHQLSSHSLLSLSSVSQHASGLQVEVFEGAESVQLPCRVEPSESDGSTAVWDQDDLRIPTVHVRQPDGDYLRDQNQRYRGRTAMTEDALQTGDLSLTLRKPAFTDSSTFTCTVRRLGEELHQEAVQLQVKEAPAPVWLWVLVVPVVLVVLVVVAVVLYYRWKKKLTAVLPSETVEVREGLKSVLLPVKTQRRLHNVRVEWSRSDRANVRIQVFENGQTRSDQQQGVYLGRTKMKADLQQTGDLSLTLRAPQLDDSGVYACVVSRGAAKLLQKAVTLRVKESLMEELEVADRAAFVLLPFKTTADLPADSKVVWSRADKHGSVHEHQSGQNQSARQNQEYLNRTEMNPDALRTGDLSLTLNCPRLADGGVFICTVYSDEDEKILKRKVLMLNVKVHQVEKVSLEVGCRSAVLPFQAPPQLLAEASAVDWRLSDRGNRLLCRYSKDQDSPAQGRVHEGHMMDEDLLTTGNCSLTISNVSLTDGVYIGSVWDQRGNILRQTVVVLRLRGFQLEIVKVTDGDPSVTLPFKIPAPLDEDVRVEWTRPDCRQTEIVSFRNGEIHSAQQVLRYHGRTEMDKDLLASGDLSLVLKRPRPKDNGLYKCCVYSGDQILQTKMVTLSVGEPPDGRFTDRLLRGWKRKTSRDPPAENVQLLDVLNPSMNQD
ncbi:uncharacterized protein LOC108166029 [Poecilia reticulata]|uniref:uncharacterized protein LOC108166029 n=1 Tax=Poecilia reticulata TaxID=8081 RepID=UPI0007EBC334|nr:PREDICTED: uncharacterized protein LOC108166029 [Poecilia reticulata]